jgi:hypothetical protein
VTKRGLKAAYGADDLARHGGNGVNADCGVTDADVEAELAVHLHFWVGPDGFDRDAYAPYFSRPPVVIV